MVFNSLTSLTELFNVYLKISPVGPVGGCTAGVMPVGNVALPKKVHYLLPGLGVQNVVVKKLPLYNLIQKWWLNEGLLSFVQGLVQSQSEWSPVSLPPPHFGQAIA